MAYSIFRFTSRNTGVYFEGGIKSVAMARKIAIKMSKVQSYPVEVQGRRGYFEKYENGEKTEWSAQ